MSVTCYAIKAFVKNVNIYVLFFLKLQFIQIEIPKIKSEVGHTNIVQVQYYIKPFFKY